VTVGALAPRPRRLDLGLAACFFASFALAWSQRFIQDDAFISLRYARNLARGLGLVFNPNERVEGYTNFLWTAWLALPFRLGLDPVVFAFASGLALYAGTLVLAIRLARALLPASARAPLMLLVILGANHTFTAYATGGLETILQTFLALATFSVLLEPPLTTPRAAGASLLAALAILTRPDSPVLLIPSIFVGMSGLGALEPRRRWRTALAGVAPALAIVGAWLAWKLRFYGAVIPNTWYVRGVGSAFLRGLGYVASFALRTLLVLALGSAAAAWIGRLRDGGVPERAAWLGIGCGTAAWLAYVMAVGGDFMEYRLLVPVLPWIALLVVAGLLRFRPAVRWAVVGALAMAGMLAPLWPHFPGVPQQTQELARMASDWERIGVALSSMEHANPPLVIGVTAAGAVPFYSGLDAVDLLGVTDPWVARHGDPIRGRTALSGSRPGHARIATADYVERRGVHLLLNHPWLTSRRLPVGWIVTCEDLEHWPDYSVSWRGHALPAGARLLEIPVDHGECLYAIQLRPHPAVDSAVAAGKWRAFALY
jgi:arabinofuranosyltransferase